MGDDDREDHSMSRDAELKGTAAASRHDPAPPATAFPLRIPLVAAIRAWGARRAFEESAKAFRAKADRNDAILEEEVSYVRLEDIDVVTEAERKRIQKESEVAQKEYEDAARAAKKATELYPHEVATEKAELIARQKRAELEAQQYERRLNPPPELPPPDPIRAGFDEIKRYAEYEEEIDKWWADVVREAGGEEHVTPTKRHMLDLHRAFLRNEMERRSRRED